MSQYFELHPDNPQPRLIRRTVEILDKGGVIIYPTDSCYALGCHLGDKAALDRIRAIRALDERHNFTLVCRDLSDIATYARVDNAAYRLIRSLTPGPYTFILRASREVPRRLQHVRRKTIGLRVPDSAIVRALLEQLHGPLMSTSLVLPGDKLPLADPSDIHERLGAQVDLVLDGGYCGIDATTVVDLAAGTPVITRRGCGDITPLTSP